MTNKPLIALGVVTALAMAGGQANAQTACPTVPDGDRRTDYEPCV